MTTEARRNTPRPDLRQGLSPIRSPWVVPPSEISRHFAMTTAVMEKRSDLSRPGVSQTMVEGALYGFDHAASLEEVRLAYQNTGHWAKDHLALHRGLAKLGHEPSRVAALGTGVDAVIADNLHLAYPKARVVVYDINPEKVKGAAETQAKRRASTHHQFEFVAGDVTAAIEPESLDHADMQLMAVHLSAGDLAKVVKSVSKGLREGGVFTLSDLLLQGWQARVAPGFEEDPEAQAQAAKAHGYIWGREGYPGAVNVAWRNRGAATWETADDLARMVEEHSGNELKRVNQVVGEEQFFDKNDARAALTAHMPPTIALQSQAAFARMKDQLPEPARVQFEGMVEATWQRGREYMETLQDPRVQHKLPEMARLVFVKAA